MFTPKWQIIEKKCLDYEGMIAFGNISLRKILIRLVLWSVSQKMERHNPVEFFLRFSVIFLRSP